MLCKFAFVIFRGKIGIMQYCVQSVKFGLKLKQDHSWMLCNNSFLLLFGFWVKDDSIHAF